ncbi:MAG TPA: glycosyltransferase [Terriglobales bacterium]|nr:glycosyltransferase [Terriglobales bacterium]
MQHWGRRVAVVVLGDLGRSPRMQYHAVRLAEAGSEIDLIGIAGTAPIAEIGDNPNIRIHLLVAPTEQLHRSRWATIVGGVSQLLQQTAQLWRVLGRIAAPQTILVQTPPALPTLAIAWLAARRRGAQLVIDWHNFSHAVLAQKLGAAGRQPWPVAALQRLELTLGRLADRHLCVSMAMAAELQRLAGIAAEVMHDRPGPGLMPLPHEERLQVRRDLLALPPAEPSFVAITSTSWTFDEDLDLLLDAAQQLDRRFAATLPRRALTIVITGDGPRRAAFEQRLAATALKQIRLRTMWLAWDDYRRLLAAADAGISLHRSASGVDLPMKIQDMLGAGLPVLALDYGDCLREVLRPGENGELFRTAAELAAILARLADS